MNQKGFVPIFVIVGTFLILGLIIAGLYLNKSINQIQLSKNTVSSSQNIPSPSSSLKTQVDIHPTCSDNNVSVDYTMPNDGTDGILAIIKTNKVTKETSSFVIEGVAEKVNEPIEIHKCYLYVIKPVSETIWELWRYNFDNKGEVIYKGNRFQFKINKPETLAALNTIIDSTEQIIIVDINSNRQILTQSSEEIKNQLQGKIGKDVLDVVGNQLRDWNSKGDELWGSLYAAAFVESFWKLNVDSKKLEVFTDLYKPTPNGVALNPDKEVYAYSGKPLFFDVQSNEQWEKENKTYSLYIYSLRSKSSMKIDSLPSNWPGGMISPLFGWESPTQLRYSTPNGQKVYTFNN